VFGKNLKGERVHLDEKEFCKKSFVLKIVPIRKDKDKPSEGSECRIKVLSKSKKVYDSGVYKSLCV
jgi:hypothetical protein